MEKYKRFTEFDSFSNEYYAKGTYKDMVNRFAELEDKIENGTLIEIDIWDKDILEEIAHSIFNNWNDKTGAINECSSWYCEMLSVINDIVGMVYGITVRQAKLKELKNERS